ncbi:MAG: methyltransferase domain-containing protein [bacterium]
MPMTEKARKGKDNCLHQEQDSRPGQREDGDCLLLDQDFWIRHWERVEKLSQKGLSKEFVKPQRWDKLSKDFSQRWKPTKEDPMRDEMISLLKERNILREGMKILDLGCGTGRFAIPFAQAGALVTAVDVSEGMLRYLEEETPKDVASRITPVKLDWHGADIDRLGFRSAFDLSFGHMTPAITGPETFLKFLSTSRQWCVMATWSGQRRQNTAEGVWRHLTGTAYDQNAGDITIPFNLLYCMGYHPSIEFRYHRHESLVDPEAEADQLFDLFHGYVQGDERHVRQRILSFLQGMAREEGKTSREEGQGSQEKEQGAQEGMNGRHGMINKVLTGCIGRMVWNVDRACSDV